MLLLFFSSGFGSSQNAGDPCDTKKTLPEPDIRIAAYEYDPAIETALCDKYKIAAGGEWFRIEIGKEMIRNESEPRACGTDTGIWMQGNVWHNRSCLLVVAVEWIVHTLHKLKVNTCNLDP
jgi:hypothetical protein